MMTKDKGKTINRRSFLRIMGWGSFFLSIGISVIGSVRFLFPRVLFESPSVFRLGQPEEFSANGGADKNGVCQVYENWKEDQSVWIVREEKRIYAIQAKCTHLGCTPGWFPDEGIFKCPCHGSRFTSNGTNFAGPAPRPLDRLRVFMDESGCICVDKSRTFTFREYNKPGAYLEI